MLKTVWRAQAEHSVGFGPILVGSDGYSLQLTGRYRGSQRPPLTFMPTFQFALRPKAPLSQDGEGWRSKPCASSKVHSRDVDFECHL